MKSITNWPNSFVIQLLIPTISFVLRAQPEFASQHAFIKILLNIFKSASSNCRYISRFSQALSQLGDNPGI